MKNLNKMMVQLRQPHSVITFDWAIYHIAKEIQWERPMEFQNTVIRLGGFHVITNFLSALGKFHQTSGLKEVLAEGGVYSDVTVQQTALQ
jgi:hypothetical protein